VLDYVIRSGTVVDGTGAPARQADVGLLDGVIVAVGRVEEHGVVELDADGMVVAPGVVDPHTHYDAQLFWDPSASPSNLHGVTTVIGGNCGFTLAPLEPGDADYLRRMMAKVEGMPLAALEHGVPWDWRSFGEYLHRLDGRLGVNAGFLVGHCALRRKVMGAARAAEVATDEEIAAMRRLLGESLAAGGLGFSSSQSRTHSDGEGQPVTSRFADRREMLAFCEEVGAHEGTTLEYITSGCLDTFSDDEISLMAEMSATARRPLNWNVLTVDSRAPEKVARQLEASDAAAAAGGRVVALTMPTLVPMNMSFLNHCALFLIPGWDSVMALPVPERMRELADPGVRHRLDELAHAESLDHWFAPLAALARSFWFFLPPVRWISDQMKLDQEFLADRRAVDHFGTSGGYASSLVALASPIRLAGDPEASTRSQTVSSFQEGGLASSLFQRVMMLLSCPFAIEGRTPLWWRWSTAATIAGVTLAASCLTLRGLAGWSSSRPSASLQAARSFRLPHLAIGQREHDDQPFDLRFRLPDHFTMTFEVMAEPAELSEIEMLGHKLGEPRELDPGRSAYRLWHRVKIIRASGHEQVEVDGQSRPAGSGPSRPATWLTIQTPAGRTTRLRDLELIW